jgi:hypothetical protein
MAVPDEWSHTAGEQSLAGTEFGLQINSTLFYYTFLFSSVLKLTSKR